MSRCVDLDERVTAQFYDQECEEWTMQTVTIEDVLDSVCDEYTVLPSAQPEIIRCRECKLRDTEYCNMAHGFMGMKDDDYCSYAERREVSE